MENRRLATKRISLEVRPPLRRLLMLMLPAATKTSGAHLSDTRCSKIAGGRSLDVAAAGGGEEGSTEESSKETVAGMPS